MARRHQPRLVAGHVGRDVLDRRQPEFWAQPRPIAPRVADDRLRARRCATTRRRSSTSMRRIWRSTARASTGNGTTSLAMGWQVPRLPGLGEVRWERFIAAARPRRLRLRRLDRARGSCLRGNRGAREARLPDRAGRASVPRPLTAASPHSRRRQAVIGNPWPWCEGHAPRLRLGVPQMRRRSPPCDPRRPQPESSSAKRH